MESSPIGLLVVGGGAAGAAAVAAYRANGGPGAVLLVTDEPVPPYQRPPLSKDFLRAETSMYDLALDDPSPEGASVLFDAEVRRIDPKDRIAQLADGRELRYETCVVATGNGPRTLPVPGGDDPGVHYLRSLADGEQLRQAAATAERAVVVGSGFIGCEAAASLARRGVRVTLVTDEDAPQLTRLGRYAAGRIEEWLSQAGVVTVLGADVVALGPGRVDLADGTGYDADLVLVAAGIAPRTDLLGDSGLLTANGTIEVDEQMRTRADGLFAAGDIVSVQHPVAGRRLTVEHWGDAVAMGSVAGANAAGAGYRWDEVPGFWSQVGEHTIKYRAWGDGFDAERPVEHGPDAFTVWYFREQALVGALTFNADRDYDRAAELIRTGTAP